MKKVRKYISAAIALSVLAAFSSCGDTLRKGEPKPSQPPVTEAPTDTVTNAVPTEPDTTAPTTEIVTETTTEEVDENEADRSLRGNIYDTNGELLLYTEGGRRVSTDGYAVPFANILTEMSAGFDLTFHDILTAENPTPVNGSEKGQSIKLTIDGEVQNAVYNYMASVNMVGSVVVMRTDGSLLAQVSYPSYDPNTVAKQDYDVDLAWGACGNKAFQNFEPGSCFKIMSEVIADKHGVTVLYDEGEWEYDGTSIVNWDHDTNPYYPVAERTLNSAFVNSSNIFFAKAFDQIGTEAVLSDLNNIFHFGTPIECDFGSLNNNIEIYCNDDLRRSAFGQSYVLTCPIYLAALGREAVFGDMVRPFVLQDTVDMNDPYTVTGSGSQAGEVIASIPSEYRQNLLNGMQGVASGLGVYLPSGYTLYAKTGTAETWEGDFLYITGCVKNDNDSGNTVYSDYSDYRNGGSYIIVTQIRNPEAHGFAFASESKQLYQGVVNTVLEND